MMKRYLSMAGLALAALFFCAACGQKGKVDQGRVIDFDRAKGTVTLVRDGSPDPKKPEYTMMPPLVYELPKDKGEMGAEPKAGHLLKVDVERSEITIFHAPSGSLRTVGFKAVARRDDVARDDAAVFDRDKKAPRKFPVVDRQKGTVSIYSAEHRLLLTFTVPGEYLSLPDKAWETGDEVRVYWMEEGRASRLMNVTRTDIFAG